MRPTLLDTSEEASSHFRVFFSRSLRWSTNGHSLAQSPISEPDVDTAGRLERARSCGRLTVTISDRELLQATNFSTLLTGFGKYLRGSAGGMLGKEIDDAAGRRFTVEEIDIFFSHSWHAPWFSKYLILLFHFNGQPAVFTAFAVGLGLFIRNLNRRTYPETSLSEVCWSKPDTDEIGDIFELCGITGGSFFFMLFMWHHIVCFLCRRTSIATNVFLDKVCIDQVDPYKKAQGIASIGAFIEHSKSVLVAWDPTYFERLWCTFELSAFFHVRPNGAMIVLPCAIGVVVCLQFAMQVLDKVIRVLYLMFGVYGTDTLQIRVFIHLVGFQTMLVTMPALRNYLRKVSSMKRQLKQFEARAAKCFCCSVQHVHPQTGQSMPCDREVVYRTIAEWYGGGCLEAGLENFDARVRGRLHVSIRKTLGSTHLSYSHALLVGLPASLYTMSFSNSCPGWVQVTRVCSILLCRGPILALLSVHAAKCFQRRRDGMLSEVLADIVAALYGTLAFNIYDYLRDFRFLTGHAYRIIAVYLLELSFVLWIWMFQPLYYDVNDLEPHSRRSSVNSASRSSVNSASRSSVHSTSSSLEMTSIHTIG